jgi:hypothetical protein
MRPQPQFAAERGRAMVIALDNSDASASMSCTLRSHHFLLLDRCNPIV